MSNVLTSPCHYPAMPVDTMNDRFVAEVEGPINEHTTVTKGYLVYPRVDQRHEEHLPGKERATLFISKKAATAAVKEYTKKYKQGKLVRLIPISELYTKKVIAVNVRSTQPGVNELNLLTNYSLDPLVKKDINKLTKGAISSYVTGGGVGCGHQWDSTTLRMELVEVCLPTDPSIRRYHTHLPVTYKTKEEAIQMISDALHEIKKEQVDYIKKMVSFKESLLKTATRPKILSTRRQASKGYCANIRRGKDSLWIASFKDNTTYLQELSNHTTRFKSRKAAEQAISSYSTLRGDVCKVYKCSEHIVPYWTLSAYYEPNKSWQDHVCINWDAFLGAKDWTIATGFGFRPKEEVSQYSPHRSKECVLNEIEIYYQAAVEIISERITIANEMIEALRQLRYK